MPTDPAESPETVPEQSASRRVFVGTKLGCITSVAVLLGYVSAGLFIGKMLRSQQLDRAIVPLLLAVVAFVISRIRRTRYGHDVAGRIDSARLQYVSPPADQSAYEVFQLAMATLLFGWAPPARWALYLSCLMALLAFVLSIIRLSQRRAGTAFLIISLLIGASFLALFAFGVAIGFFAAN